MNRFDEGRIENLAETFYKKYKTQMEDLSKSPLAKLRGSLSAFDIYGLGMQLENFDSYMAVCEEDGNTNQLGQLPKIAYDVITAVHGVSILPMIASVQPIEEERGNVYFKNVRASDTKGSITAGDVLVDPRTGVKTGQGYAGNRLVQEVLVNTGGTPSTQYVATVAAFPLRSGTIRVTVQDDDAVFAQDIGVENDGMLLGKGLSGQVDYNTGDVSIDFVVAPAANVDIYISYQQNYELSNDIPQIEQFFDSRPIQAQVYALKGTIGMLQSYAMRKRFGLVAEDEVAKDLVQEINREIGADLIRKMRISAMGATVFDRTPPSANISFFEHKQTYKDAMATAEATLVGNAGRGTISMLAVGSNHAAVIQTLPGFRKLYDGNGLSAHLYGELDGTPVIRVTESAILGTNEGLAMWRGQSPFEAPAVYAPYMPLVVTSTLPEAPNPLVSMKAAAVWAGVEDLVPEYVTRFDITQS